MIGGEGAVNGDSVEAWYVHGVGVKCAWNGRGMGSKSERREIKKGGNKGGRGKRKVKHEKTKRG